MSTLILRYIANSGSAQSHAWESLVSSRKRSWVTRQKPSPVEKLAKDLNSIMHEEQLYYLSGSLEEDLLYHSETPVGSLEIGSGSVLLRHPNLKSLEEESEASSIPADNKSYITSESYSGSASFVAHSGNRAAINLNAATARPKRSPLHIEDNARRYCTFYVLTSILLCPNKECNSRYAPGCPIVQIHARIVSFVGMEGVSVYLRIVFILSVHSIV